ncbi:MAG: SDR family NAD(P)-dependent oxidoreductase [Candidatus Margulisbacteria bacterium]|nr:SDR family NAD(P)-dependent oxidoreductase [Candidatus Margulisiibacteriota bacterium]
MTRVLITGGAGFIGSSLGEALLKQGVRVVSVDNVNNFYNPQLKKANIQRLSEYPGFESIEADIRNQTEIDGAFDSSHVDVVVHLAAMAGVRPSIEQPRLYYDVNVNGTFNVLDACARYRPKKVVLGSSSSVYGNNKTVPFSESDNVDRPISPYAATKKMNEIMAYNMHHLHGVPICCCRFFTVYGPYQRPEMAIHKFTRMILNDEPIPVYNFGNCERDYTYIDDIVQGLLSIMETPFEFDVVNLGGSATITTSALIDRIGAACRKSPIIHMMPAQVGDVDATHANIDHAKRVYGYNPRVEIHQGVKRFVEWFQCQSVVR